MSSSSNKLITLSGVTAFHLVGTDTIPLTPDSPQDLTILSDPSSSPPSLTLTIGSSLAFPLKGATFGTQASNPRGYFLKPVVGDGPSGWIKIELADGVVENGERDKWESILTENGFLSGEVVEAKADDAANAIRENTAPAPSSESSGIKKEKVTSSEPANPTEFSQSTHASLNNASSAAETAQFYTHAAASTAMDLAYKVGAGAGDAMGIRGGEPTAEEDKSDLRKDAEAIGSAAVTLGSGIAEGATNLASEGLTNAQTLIHENYGKEAEDVANKAGEVAKKAGNAALEATMATSMLGHGYEASKGAVGSTKGVEGESSV